MKNLHLSSMKNSNLSSRNHVDDSVGVIYHRATFPNLSVFRSSRKYPESLAQVEGKNPSGPPRKLNGWLPVPMRPGTSAPLDAARPEGGGAPLSGSTPANGASESRVSGIRGYMGGTASTPSTWTSVGEGQSPISAGLTCSVDPNRLRT